MKKWKKWSIALLILASLVVSVIRPWHVPCDPQDKEWYQQLPACPCQQPDPKQVGDGWAVDVGGKVYNFHEGAAICYRSYPRIQTSAGMSGQQCCYDAQGHLITSGKGAGTPDKVGNCSGEDAQGIMTIHLWGTLGHYWNDVRAYSFGHWEEYNRCWVPNRGRGCE